MPPHRRRRLPDERPVHVLVGVHEGLVQDAEPGHRIRHAVRRGLRRDPVDDAHGARHVLRHRGPAGARGPRRVPASAVVEPVLAPRGRVQVDPHGEAVAPAPPHRAEEVRPLARHVHLAVRDVARDPVAHGDAHVPNARVLDPDDVVFRHEVVPVPFQVNFCVVFAWKGFHHRPLVHWVISRNGRTVFAHVLAESGDRGIHVDLAGVGVILRVTFRNIARCQSEEIGTDVAFQHEPSAQIHAVDHRGGVCIAGYRTGTGGLGEFAREKGHL
mmetsp:Transcript_24181/g.48063  ORF Transcript_24181/g.48063 Transcript_24181/m.48063 type:complete len:271 (+) Transcript_24181:1166-1978(+)